LPRLLVLDFGMAGTGGIPCITTQINFQLLPGTQDVRDLRVDFCTDASSFDVLNVVCQTFNPSVMLDPAPQNQLSCELDQPDDPRGQVRVTAHGAGGAALPNDQVLFTCSVPVLPTTVTGQYTVDYSILATTTGDESFVDFGQSTISILADDLSQGQCCGVDSQCSSGFCRGGYVPEQNSVCCEDDCANGVCNHPSSLGTCLEFPGAEFGVSTISYRSQIQPDVAVLDDGFVVAWAGTALDLFLQHDILARRFDRFGVAVGSEITVNEAVVADQRFAHVAALGAGFVVAWSDPYGVYGRRFDGAGDPVGGQFQANTYAGGYQYYTAVGAAPDGGFTVVWDSFGQDGYNQGVFARRFDSLGDSIGTEFQVNTYTYGTQEEPAVGFAGDGSFVVVWEDYERGAVGQRFDSAGVPVGGEIVAEDLMNRPDVAVRSDGAFVVTGEGFDGSYFPGVFGRRFDSSGAPVGDRFQVNTYTFDGQRLGTVAFGDGGSFVITWKSFGQDGYRDGIFAQRFSSAGERLGTEFQVNSYTASDEKEAAIAAGDGAGGFVVVWEGAAGGNYPAIRGQRLP
jgi:hypothetical protein